MIRPSLPGTVVERDVDRPRARPDAEDADPVLRRGRPPTAVAVPCELVTGWPGRTLKFGSPVHSGWVGSAAASTSAISGLSGVTGGGESAGSTTFLRQSFGRAESGSSGTAWSESLRRTLACA